MTSTGAVDNKGHDRRTGTLVLIALLAASLEPVLIRLGYRGSATPAQLWIMRAVVAAVVVVPITRSLKPLRRPQLKAILGVGPLLLVTSLGGLMALRHVPVALSVTAMSATPALVAMGNQVLGRDKSTVKFWFGLFICVCGVALSANLREIDFDRDYGLGILFVLCAMISSTIYRLRLEGLTKIVEPQVASTWFFVLNGILAVCLIPVCARLDGAIDGASWVLAFPSQVFYIAMWAGVAAVLANIMFVKAVQLLGSTRMSVFDLLQRPIVIVLAAVILGESISILQALGFVLVVIGVKWAKVVRS
jgi:drug/metabolite transporter (DMT)-like permease